MALSCPKATTPQYSYRLSGSYIPSVTSSAMFPEPECPVCDRAEFPLLFHWSTCLFFVLVPYCSYYYGYNLKLGTVVPSVPFFSVYYRFGYLEFLCFQVHFKTFFLICEDYHGNFDGHCVESITHCWLYSHFHNINSDDSWRRKSFHFPVFS